MRSNIFLHFLNRDTREIFGVDRQLKDPDHFRLMRRALNASVALCEDHCIAPPGFIVEDEIAFNLAEAQRAYLHERVFQFPIRESSLSDYAEKKRIGYYPMRSRYSGLFDDTRIGFLGQHAQGLIHRQSHITEGILVDWREGAEAKRRAWEPVKKILSPADVEIISRIPIRLSEAGTALTWAAIEPLIPPAGRAAFQPLRNALQYTYFRQYCAEFGLIILTQIPYIIDDFFLPRKAKSYSYPRLQQFLNQFGLASTILDAPAEFLIALRRGQGFIRFMDAYAALGEQSNTMTDLQFAASRVVRTCKFEWEAYAARRRGIMLDINPLEILELDHALEEAAGLLSAEYGLPQRIEALAPLSPDRKLDDRRLDLDMTASASPDLVLFVALDEELEVLATHLKLTKNHLVPAASGKIGVVPIHVICPKDMGRVPAAVAVAGYLESRKTALPKLILIVGLAGGFQEEGAEPGHTICVTTVVDLASRKVIDADGDTSSTKFRRRDFNMNPALKSVLTSHTFDQKKWVEEATDAAEWPKDRRPSVQYGLLASVDEVISSDSWRKKLLAHTEKLLGVEMEAGGVCAAADRYSVPYCMLRIVSDNADPAKADDQWRLRGMKTMAHLLAHIPFAAVFEAMQA